MNRLLYILTSILMCISYRTLAEGNPKSDLVNLFNKYKDASSIDLKFEMHLYGVGGQNNISKSFIGIVKISENLYYSSLMGKTTINNDEIRLMIDDNSHLVMCSDGMTDNAYKEFAKGIIISNELLNGLKINYKSNTDETTVIEVEDSSNGNRMLYTINKKNGLLAKYECLYNSISTQGISRMEITYSKMDVNVKIDKSIFSTKEMIRKSGKGCSLQGKYSTYQLIDQTKK